MRKLAGIFLTNKKIAINSVIILTITVGEVKLPNSIKVLSPRNTSPLFPSQLILKNSQVRL